MSVIQKIQDKYGKVMAVIIGLALVVFVIMLAFENGGSLFAGDTTTVGKVNGESIDYNSFRLMVDQQTQMMEQQQMGATGEVLAQQANESAWNTEVARILLSQEAQKLGVEIGKKELNDLLFGTNPPQEMKQAFTDPQTGVYDPAVAQQQINAIRSSGSPEQKASLNGFLDQVVFQRLAEKYDALLSSSINFPKWMFEKENAQSALISKVSFVREPYTSISDSSVKVSTSEIQSYIDKHKKDFKQTENRSIGYIAFNAQPSGADSAAIEQSLLDLKPAFDSARNIKQFLMAQGENNYYDGYVSSNRIMVPEKEAIFAVGAGNIFGPYVDGERYAMAKVVAARPIPDTVSVRHILIGLYQQDPSTGQRVQIRDTASAKKLADSIALAIRNGASFDSMVTRFSNDAGSISTGGRIDDIPSGQNVAEFNDFTFTNPVGSKGVVKTEYGYHYVEILSQKGSAMGYKIAYLSKRIEASPETDMAANNEATKFAAVATDAKSFNAQAEKLQKEKGIFKSVAQNIPPSGAMIQGLGASRSFVKSIYNAKLGDVLQPERVGDYYVIALVTEVNEDGTVSAEKARPMVEPLLINEKKAEIIAKKIGKITTLENAAGILKKEVEVADSLSFDGQTVSALGFEPKVIGAAFNKDNLNKVVNQPIAGSQGVYVLRVDNLSSRPVQSNSEETRKMMTMQAQQQARFQSFQALREAAELKDYRSKFF